MKILLPFFFIIVTFAACENKSTTKKGLDKDTMEVIPGYGAGHDPGTAGSQSPSYPKPAITNEQSDTARGIHGVNVDSTGSNPRN